MIPSVSPLSLVPDPAVPAMPKRLLTVDETAAAIRMSGRWVRAQVASGRIKSIQLGRARRIPTAEVERILREGL